VLAVVGIIALHHNAHYVYDRLTGKALPLVIVSALAGVAVLVLLRRGAQRYARPVAIVAVVAVVWGWGVAQYPYLLPTSLTIEEGAGAPGTLTWVLVVFLFAAVTAVPALGFLYVLHQRGRLLERDQPLGPEPL
jgi:cytochrome bd ubiquinol oxidase subunit II